MTRNLLDCLPYLYDRKNGFVPPSKECIDQILKDSMDQAIFLPVFSLLEKYMDPGTLNLWQSKYWTGISRNICNQNAHQRLHELLSSNDISYVVLKGMASARYYANPILRSSGDVDFLVSQIDLSRATTLLENNGIKPKSDNKHGFHKAFWGQKMVWEMHWAPPGIPEKGVAGNRIRDCLSDIIEQAEYYDGYMIPSSFHHGIILLVHSISHLTTTGIGLRHLFDWAVFVDSYSDDVFCDTFEETLKKIGLWEYAKVITSVCIKYLGSDNKTWVSGVDDKTVDLLMKDILDSGNFGSKDDQRIIQAKLIRDDQTRKIKDGRIRLILSNLNVRARREMPITKKVPVLLPIGWLVVCFKYIFIYRKGKNFKSNIGKTISDAEERKKLYKQLKIYENIS